MSVASTQISKNWKVIHDHDTLTFNTFCSALAYARGYAKESDILEIVDPAQKEIVLLSDTDHLAVKLAA